MLTVLNKRLLDGMEIKKVKEKPSKYEITFLFKGDEVKGELPKTSAPGMQNQVVDRTIFNAACAIALRHNDVEGAKIWLERMQQYA